MKIDIEILQKLENTIDTIHPEKGEVPIKILGFGEISLVFELLEDPKIAYKRIPIFDSEKQIQRHIRAYNEYNRILEKEIGISIPESDAVWVKNPKGVYVLYAAQEKVPSETIGNKIIHNLKSDEINKLILQIMREYKKIWKFSMESELYDIGFDGQISNFSIVGYDPTNPKIPDNAKLIYLDTSTPLYRKNGIEAMEAELFLKSAPSFLRFLIKLAFLGEVVDRYYDLRLVTIDLIANFFKEQRPELIPSMTRVINKFFKEEASEFDIKPITLEEIQKYYKSDKMIWVIFQNARKIDRFIKTKLLRKKYDFYLPEDIER